MNYVGLYFVSNHMRIHFNVFCSFVEDQIVDNVYAQFVVIVNGDLFRVSNSKILKKLKKS